jgi:hypothetical protein
MSKKIILPLKKGDKIKCGEKELELEELLERIYQYNPNLE